MSLLKLRKAVPDAPKRALPQEVSRDGVDSAYRLFLGRQPESDAVLEGNAGKPPADLVSMLLASEEFEGEVIEPLLERRPVSRARFAEPVETDLAGWAARNLPLANPKAAAAALTIWKLYEALFSDPEFRELAAKTRPALVKPEFLEAIRARARSDYGFKLLFDPKWFVERLPEGAVLDREPLAAYLKAGEGALTDPHPLFDTRWYLAQRPELRGRTPLEHYMSQGAAAGLSPHPLFDTRWYLAQLQEPPVGDPLTHYIVEGAGEGLDPHPLFDSDWYLARHPDVGAQGFNPLIHYIKHGARELHDGGIGRRTHPLLDIRGWTSRHPDAAVGTELPLLNYLRNGDADEDFNPHPLFETAWYVARWPEREPVAPLEHYIRHSRTTAPNRYFDTAWYCAEYLADAPPQLSPLQHYVECWRPERPRLGRCDPLPQPHPLFDAGWYIATNPEVAAAGFEPLHHYLQHGAREGRRPHRFFDPEFYRRWHDRDPAAQADPLGHYLSHGRDDACDPNPFFDNGWYARTQALTRSSALEHFIHVGEAEGRSPHPLWDEQRYLAINPDVAKLHAAGGVTSGYRHFVEHGVPELERGASRAFAFAWGEHILDYDRPTYLADNPDVQTALERGRFRGGLEHLFVVGYREAIDGLRAIYSPRHALKLLQDLPGGAPNGGRHLCLFAHYDRDDVIDAYVVTYLSSLRKAGVDIVLITATGDPEELDKVRPLVKRILVKNATGRDFGSWRLALSILGLDCGAGYDRVIFANDSFYFPVRPIEPLFADMERKRYNLYALSDSREAERYHLQSYFLCFDRAAQNALFGDFSRRFDTLYALPKAGQIREFEYGLTKMAQDKGLSVGANLSIDDVRETLIHTAELAPWAPMVRFGLGGVNPSHDLWDISIARFGWPALKVELLRDNPKGAKGFEALPKLIADGDVSYAEIKAHQKRMRTAAPLRPNRISVPASAPEVVLLERKQGRAREDAKRLVLFAHYDPDGIVDGHVKYQLQKLSESGCDICFITSARESEQLDIAAAYCCDILVKNEAGRDFGSWDLAIRTLRTEFDRYDSVIWMNDSTYFPLFDLGPMFEQMDDSGADFWGIVDSSNVTWHVMSWFWSFSRRLIDDGWFEWYLRNSIRVTQNGLRFTITR